MRERTDIAITPLHLRCDKTNLKIFKNFNVKVRNKLHVCEIYEFLELQYIYYN